MKNLISKVAEGYIANKTKSYAIESQQNSAADSEIPKIHLDLGESLIGPSANVDVKLKSLTGKDLLDYPDTVLEQLKTNIAEFYNTPKRNVILGTGPGTFIFEYSQYHSALLNQTLFWGTRFFNGNSAFLDWAFFFS